MLALGIALRFLGEGRLQTMLILVGISVGIAVQIFLSSLIGGLQKDLINRTVGTAPHITVSMPEPVLESLFPDSVAAISRQISSGTVRPISTWLSVMSQLENTGYFTAISPVAEGGGLVYKGERSLGVLLRGINLDKADKIYSIRSRIVEGRATLSSNNVLIGRELARLLRLKTGSILRIAAADGRTDVFTVAGIFDLESRPVNETWIFLPLRRAQSLLGFESGITSIETQVPEVFAAQTIAEALARSFPGLAWVSWQENNANLLQALSSQSSSSNLIQVLVLAAVTLGISSVLAVSAMQKSRQIGILKAMGATRAVIGRIFLIMGAILGAGGAVIGCFAGYGLIALFLWGTAQGTGQPLFPLSVEPSLYIISVAIATAAGTLAAFIPAQRSARLNPVEVIRNG